MGILDNKFLLLIYQTKKKNKSFKVCMAIFKYFCVDKIQVQSVRKFCVNFRSKNIIKRCVLFPINPLEIFGFKLETLFIFTTVIKIRLSSSSLGKKRI